MTVQIIDAAEDVRHALDSMWAAGTRAIIRYDCRLAGGRWKEATNAEIQAILNRGMAAGIVNEGVGAVITAFDDSTGYADAAYSLARAQMRKQPDGSAIYFAVDMDATPAQVDSRIIPYFQGVRRAYADAKSKLRVGCYGSGYVCAALSKLIDLSWITCSGGFLGSRAFVNADREDLWQYACERNYYGIDADYNTYPAHKGDWGQWSQEPPVANPPSPSPGAPVWLSTWGSNVGKASWYNDHQNADGTPVDNSRDISCATLHVPFGTKLRVTRIDTGASVENVVVHDRGPYYPGRIIDLRPKVAQMLGMIEAGVVPVKLEVMPS